MTRRRILLCAKRPQRPHRCLVCGAPLAADHGNEWRCSCHVMPPPEQQWKPRLDGDAKGKVLTALRARAPLPVDLRYVLHTEDRQALNDIVRILRREGHRIEGCRPAGYCYCGPPL